MALRLAEAKTHDLTPKVNEFLKTLLHLEKKERLRAARLQRKAEIDEQIAAMGDKIDKEDPHTIYLLSLQVFDIQIPISLC